MHYGPRPAGSDALRQTGDYILEQLQQAGWATQEQQFEYLGTRGRNLIARSDNSDSPVIILGAHYDTRREASRDAENPQAPVPGANDGASGVAVLLELARVLDTQSIESSVWLVFFDAEDNGGLDGWDWIVGSSYFVEYLEFAPEFAVIVDMVGDGDQQLFYESNSDEELRSQIWATAASLDYDSWFIPQVGYSILDDHTPFLNAGIPAVDIIDFDYPYWHTQQDTVDKVDAESLERVGLVLEAFLERNH